jgi:hypothetical protein
MRHVLLASLVALSAVVTSAGCTAFGCGDFDGGANRAYERGSNMLLLCDNAGFVVSLDTTMLEGRYSTEARKTVGTKGDDGSIAFELVENDDGTASAAELGDGAWTYVPLDKVAADHANVLCEDLEVRDWWTAQ